jgi:hypothetical protein
MEKVEAYARLLLSKGAQHDELAEALRPYVRAIIDWRVGVEQQIEGVLARGGETLH